MAKDRLIDKLAVILHADVIGSTQLVQKDEHLTHERIQQGFHRFDNLIGKYCGKVLELRGDALLAEFERPSDAVTAALAFQAEHSVHVSQLSDDIKPHIRIGITLGEVVIADGTITGGGVVLAQRVEQLSTADGLCITAAIHEALPNRMPFEQEDMGEQKLKGFDEPVRVYRVRLKPGTSIPPPKSALNFSSARGKRLSAAGVTILLIATMAIIFWHKPWIPAESQPSVSESPTGDKRSIAVLPFDNMSEDPNQQYFSDGIAEDIITDLSQLSDLAVIARNSSFTYRGKSTKVQEIGTDLGVRYLLEGSVRKAGNNIRITVQLVDTGNGHHLWAERFDRELTDVFAVQDEITQKIVSELSIQLTGDEQQKISHNATNSFEAYDLFLQGQGYRSYSRQDLDQAEAAYTRVIKLDPSFARAYGALAVTLNRQVIAGHTNTPEETKQRSFELAQKAVSIYPHSPHVQWALGYVYMYKQQFENAVEALEHAILLSPSYADGYALLALIKNNLGQSEEAIRLLETGMKLNPHFSWDYLYNLGRAYYALGQYNKATEYLAQALQRNETPSHPRLFLAASLVQLGQIEDAEWEVMQLETSHPQMTLSHLRQTLPISDSEMRKRLLSDLHQAGMSE